MGRTVIIVFFVIIVILTLIITSVSSKVQDLPETVTEQVVFNQVKYISNYALTYAIQQLIEKNYAVNSGISEKPFENFQVLNGRINKITLDINSAQDTIIIISDVTCNLQNISADHISRSVVAYDPKIVNPSGITDAITTTGKVEIKGSAVVNGTVAENTLLDFEEIFGYSREEVRFGANRIYVDPPNSFLPVDNITWVEYVDNTDANITANGWVGSGLLIVDGDLIMTGGYFYGIIWVTGTMDMSVGGGVVEGAIVVEGAPSNEKFKVGGNATVTYNEDAINQYYQLLNIPERNKYTILTWYE